MKSRSIYFDYQSSTPLDEEVFEFMKPLWFETHGNPHSNEHSIGWSANKIVDKLFDRRDIERIFSYRQHKLNLLLNDEPTSA